MAIASRILIPLGIASILVAQVQGQPQLSQVAVLKLIPDSASAVSLIWRPAEADERYRKGMAAFGEKSGLLDLDSTAHLSLEDLAPGPMAEVHFPESKGAKETRKGKAGAEKDVSEEGKKPSRKVTLIPVKNAKALGVRLKARADGAVQRYEWKTAEATQVRYLAFRGGHLLVSEAKDALTQAIKPGPSIEAELAPRLPWMQEHDIVAMATGKAVKQALDELAEGGSGQPGAPGAAIADLFKELIAKARASVQHAAMGLDLPKDGAPRMTARAFFTPSSPLALEAAALQSMPGHPLGRLPEGPYALAMGGQWPLSMGFFDKLASQYPGLEAKDQREMTALLAKVNDQVLRTSFRLRAPQAGEPFMQALSGVSELKDGKAWMAAMKQQQAWSQSHLGAAYTFQDAVLPGLPSLTVSVDLGKLLGGKLPPAQVAMAGGLLFGGNRMQISYAVLDERTLAYTFGDQEALRAVVAEVQKGKPLSATKGIQGADALLPRNGRYMLYLDPRGFQSMVAAVMKAFTGKAPDVSEVAETLPMVSAIAMDPGGIQVSASARPESVEAMSKVFSSLSPAKPGDDGDGDGGAEADEDPAVSMEDDEVGD